MFRSILAEISRRCNQVLNALIWAYRLCLSPILGNRCRFYPSCSCYAQEALKLHTTPKALWLIVKRLLKCQPWHPGGYDPVPQKKK